MGVLIGLAFGLGLALMTFAMSDQTPVVRGEPRPGRLAQLLARAGVHGVSGTQVVALSAAVGLSVAFAAFVVTAVASVALVLGALAAVLPVAVLRSRAARRQRAHAESWPDAVDHLASAVRAGMSLPEALMQLGERGPEPLREPFVQFGHDYQSSGRFADSLDRLKERLADPVGDRVVEALRIAREVGGGDLGRLLRNLSGFLRDDVRTRGELEARAAWTISGARLAVAAPWLVLLVMSFQRDVITRFATPTGFLLLGGGAVTCVVAYRLMLRLGRLPTEPRILA